MCGRFVLTTDPRTLARVFRLNTPSGEQAQDTAFDFAPDEDIRPGERVLTLRREAKGSRWERPRWGFTVGDRRFVINARLETAQEKAAFRQAFAEGRCVVPADGWYEWPVKGGPPTLLAGADGRPLALAGLVREGAPGAPSEVVILTTASHPAIAAIHDRMPAILPVDSIDAWLDPRVRSPKSLRHLVVTTEELPLATRAAAPLPARKALRGD